MGRVIPKNTLVQAKALFIGGATTTEVAKLLGMSWQSARNFRARFNSPICKCGKKSNHKGRCRPSLVAVSTTTNTSAFQLSESYTVVVPDGCGGRCVGDLACPYPAINNYRCRQHAIDSRLNYSFLSSTLSPDELFMLPERNRTPKRNGCR